MIHVYTCAVFSPCVYLKNVSHFGLFIHFHHGKSSPKDPSGDQTDVAPPSLSAPERAPQPERPTRPEKDAEPEEMEPGAGC